MGQRKGGRKGLGPLRGVVVVRADKYAVTSATGLVGRQLVKHLMSRGDEVNVLTRDKDKAKSQLGSFNALSFYSKMDWGSGIEGTKAVINLAGEPISTRWSEGIKKEIRDSRVNTTQYLADLIRSSKTKPEVFVSGSAIGFYGTSEDKTFTEESASGNDFLADVCKSWESAAYSSSSSSSSGGGDGDDGPRVVCLRTGLVLSKEGGILEKMVPLFQFFVGSPLGSGNQYMSWIHRDDLVALVVECIENSAYAGPVNGTAPQPVTMNAFSDTLALVLRRPMFLPPVPDLPIQILLGEGAILVLEGQKVIPKKAMDLGFKFKYEGIKKALEHAVRY